MARLTTRLPPRRRALRPPPWPLAVLVVGAFVHAVAWGIVQPPLQGPDEIEHVAYVQQLAETGSPPVQNSPGAPWSSEIQTALLELDLGLTKGNIEAHPSWSGVDRRAWASYQRRIASEQRKDGTGANAQARTPPLFYLLAAPPYLLTPGGGLLDRVAVVRLVNAVLFAAVVWLTWLLAAEIFRWSVTARLVAAGAVALHPKLAALAGNVGPDVLLALTWTLFALLAVRVVRYGPTVGRAISLAAVTGASVLTQPRGLALIPVAVVAALLALQYHRPPVRTGLKLLAAGTGVLGICVAIAALWSAHGAGPGGGGAFGGEVTQQSGATVRAFFSYVFQFYFGDWGFMLGDIGPAYGWRQMYIETFFGGFANLEVGFTPATVDKLQITVAAGLVTLWTQLVWFRDRVVARWRPFVLLASMPLSMLFVLHLSAYRDMTVNPADPLITGRYLTPLIALFGLTVAFVCVHVPRRAVPWLCAAVLMTGVVVSVSAMGITLTRFYA